MTRKRKEEPFREALLEKLKEEFFKYNIEKEFNLQYSPFGNNSKNKKRGKFSIDIIIGESGNNEQTLLPLVAIEVKYGITTHDVITYDKKAELHKIFYPQLMYGIIIAKIGTKNKNIPYERVISHSQNLDFIINMEKLWNMENEKIEFTEEGTSLLQKVIETQLDNAKLLMKIIHKETFIKSLWSKIERKKVGI